MSLILATGSNLGNKGEHLAVALESLSKHFTFISQSQIYHSKAVDYLDQPDFYNQVLEFEIPKLSPQETMRLILNIEKSLGRKRDIDKGPRTVDIDIIFWGLEKITEANLIIPHPRWQDRSFVALPLQQLPFFKTLEKSLIIPSTFDNSAYPV